MLDPKAPPVGSRWRSVGAAVVAVGAATFAVFGPIFWSDPPPGMSRTEDQVTTLIACVAAAFAAGVVPGNGFLAARRRLGLATPQQLDAVGRALATGQAPLAPHLAPVVVFAAEERLRWTDDRPKHARLGAIVGGACVVAFVVAVATWPGEPAEAAVSWLPFGVVVARWFLLAPRRVRAIEAARAASLARMRPPPASARR